MRPTLPSYDRAVSENGRQNGYSASGAEALRAAPGIARITAGMWWRAAGWTFSTSSRAVGRVARAAAMGESAGELIDVARSELGKGVRALLGSEELEEPTAADPTANGHADEPLKERAASLLDHSADVEHDEEVHPAYERIIDELAPDEIRILRLFAKEGSQAAIDVKTWRPFGAGASTVAPGLTMIAPRAGARHPERVSAYLGNLFRLGLIWFSQEPVEDLSAYQVLEAQPETTTAMTQAGRARIVRRSIRLTPFGQDFCERALP